MKILVVGGAGYIGGYLVDDLWTNGYDVTVYDSLIYELRFLKNIPFIFGDIRDRKKLAKILPTYDIVVWLAAIVGDGACAVDPFLSQSINEDSVKWLVNNYCGKIIFMSTSSVYGMNKELIDEFAPTNPLSIYAETKLAAEQYIIQKYPNFLIFRLGTLYGMGDMHSRIRLDLVVNYFAKQAVMGKDLTIFGGQQWRPLLHVRDVSCAILWGIKHNIVGLFNLSTGNYTIKEIAAKVQEHAPNIKITFQEQLTEDNRNYRIDCKKWFETGWEGQHTLDAGIQEIMDIIKDKRLKNVHDGTYVNESHIKNNHIKL
jgi:nucleoside-diphosphate-sugar epimerase